MTQAPRGGNRPTLARDPPYRREMQYCCCHVLDVTKSRGWPGTCTLPLWLNGGRAQEEDAWSLTFWCVSRMAEKRKSMITATMPRVSSLRVQDPARR